jgi:hypothetical protein
VVSTRPFGPNRWSTAAVVNSFEFEASARGVFDAQLKSRPWLDASRS